MADRVNIRKATPSDLGSIDTLAATYRNELGFVRRVTLAEAIRRGEVLVAENDAHVVAFVHYHHRLDLQTTLYNIAVLPNKQGHGIGKRLVEALADEMRCMGKQYLLLKCPSELPANSFYARLGFQMWGEEPGKRRALTLWRLSV